MTSQPVSLENGDDNYDKDDDDDDNNNNNNNNKISLLNYFASE